MLCIWIEDFLSVFDLFCILADGIFKWDLEVDKINKV